MLIIAFYSLYPRGGEGAPPHLDECICFCTLVSGTFTSAALWLVTFCVQICYAAWPRGVIVMALKHKRLVQDTRAGGPGMMAGPGFRGFDTDG